MRVNKPNLRDQFITIKNNGAEEGTPSYPFNLKQHPRVIPPFIVLREVENHNKNPGGGGRDIAQWHGTCLASLRSGV